MYNTEFKNGRQTWPTLLYWYLRKDLYSHNNNRQFILKSTTMHLGNIGTRDILILALLLMSL